LHDLLSAFVGGLLRFEPDLAGGSALEAYMEGLVAWFVAHIYSNEPSSTPLATRNITMMAMIIKITKITNVFSSVVI
jgi:hypothetical protein